MNWVILILGLYWLGYGITWLWLRNELLKTPTLFEMLCEKFDIPPDERDYRKFLLIVTLGSVLWPKFFWDWLMRGGNGPDAFT